MGSMLSYEYKYFLLGVLISAAIFGGYSIVKKSGLFSLSPDDKITYRNIENIELRLHVFNAKGKVPAPGSPLILLFHGGAWQYGNPGQFYRQCQYFSRRGMTCASAEYRIGSVHGTDPRAALDDARAALDYVRQNSTKFRIDPARIIVGGGSAGGHLAAALGVGLPASLPPTEPSHSQRPSALVLYNPMLDLSPCTPDHHLVSAFWRDLSPYNHIDNQIPPTLILLGTEDPEVPVPTAQAFCDAVKSHHGQCRLVLYDGARHGFFNPEIENGKYFMLTNQEIEQFINELKY